jgi:transposase
VPGIGKMLALTILYEIHDITRFDRVQALASYARLVTRRAIRDHRSGSVLRMMRRSPGSRQATRPALTRPLPRAWRQRTHPR